MGSSIKWKKEKVVYPYIVISDRGTVIGRAKTTGGAKKVAGTRKNVTIAHVDKGYARGKITAKAMRRLRKQTRK